MFSSFLCKIRSQPPWGLMLISMVFSVASYLQIANAPFISDDNALYITGNAKLIGLAPAEVWRLLVEPFNPVEFLPLRDFSYWIDIKLFGLIPVAFRLHNILLYLICCSLVYVTTASLWRYFRPAEADSATWFAAAVTALFTIHPAHVEAVVWISGRKDVLSGMCSMLALWCALKTGQDQGIFRRYTVLTFLAFAAAIFSKGVSVALAPIIAILWILFCPDTAKLSRRASQFFRPLFILVLAAALAVIFATHSTIKGTPYWGIETVTRALAALGWMARLAVSPEARHYFYPVFEDKLFMLMVALGGVIILAGVFGSAILWKKRSLEGFAIVAFILLCIPYTQLIPFNTFSLVSDRFLFLALWPAALLTVSLVWRLKPAYRIIILLAIALPWLHETAQRPSAWRNVETLAEADLNAFPGHYLPALYKINQVLLPKGLYGEAREVAGTISDSEMKQLVFALIQSDYYVYAYAWSTGKSNEAIASLLNLDAIRKRTPEQTQWNPSLAFIWESIRIRLDIRWKYLAGKFPADAQVRYNFGLWLLENGKYEEAAANIRAATELSPLGAEAYCALAKVYRNIARIDESARAEIECNNRALNEKAAQ